MSDFGPLNAFLSVRRTSAGRPCTHTALGAGDGAPGPSGSWHIPHADRGTLVRLITRAVQAQRGHFLSEVLRRDDAEYRLAIDFDGEGCTDDVVEVVYGLMRALQRFGRARFGGNARDESGGDSAMHALGASRPGKISLHVVCQNWWVPGRLYREVLEDFRDALAETHPGWRGFIDTDLTGLRLPYSTKLDHGRRVPGSFVRPVGHRYAGGDPGPSSIAVPHILYGASLTNRLPSATITPGVVDLSLSPGYRTRLENPIDQYGSMRGRLNVGSCPVDVDLAVFERHFGAARGSVRLSADRRKIVFRGQWCPLKKARHENSGDPAYALFSLVQNAFVFHCAACRKRPGYWAARQALGYLFPVGLPLQRAEDERVVLSSDDEEGDSQPKRSRTASPARTPTPTPTATPRVTLPDYESDVSMSPPPAPPASIIDDCTDPPPLVAKPDVTFNPVTSTVLKGGEVIVPFHLLRVAHTSAAGGVFRFFAPGSQTGLVFIPSLPTTPLKFHALPGEIEQQCRERGESVQIPGGISLTQVLLNKYRQHVLDRVDPETGHIARPPSRYVTSVLGRWVHPHDDDHIVWIFGDTKYLRQHRRPGEPWSFDEIADPLRDSPVLFHEDAPRDERKERDHLPMIRRLDLSVTLDQSYAAFRTCVKTLFEFGNVYKSGFSGLLVLAHCLGVLRFQELKEMRENLPILLLLGEADARKTKTARLAFAMTGSVHEASSFTESGLFERLAHVSCVPVLWDDIEKKMGDGKIDAAQLLKRLFDGLDRIVRGNQQKPRTQVTLTSNQTMSKMNAGATADEHSEKSVPMLTRLFVVQFNPSQDARMFTTDHEDLTRREAETWSAYNRVLDDVAERAIKAALDFECTQTALGEARALLTSHFGFLPTRCVVTYTRVIGIALRLVDLYLPDERAAFVRWLSGNFCGQTRELHDPAESVAALNKLSVLSELDIRHCNYNEQTRQLDIWPAGINQKKIRAALTALAAQLPGSTEHIRFYLNSSGKRVRGWRVHLEQLGQRILFPEDFLYSINNP